MVRERSSHLLIAPILDVEQTRCTPDLVQMEIALTPITGSELTNPRVSATSILMIPDLSSDGITPEPFMTPCVQER